MGDFKKIKPSEAKIVKAVSSLFKKAGLEIRKTELQICERFIDLACWNRDMAKVVAVEAKVKAPAKAFEQALRYRYVADYVYVAILKNGCNERAIELSKKTGIGLIFVRRDSSDRYYARVEIESLKSKFKDANLAKYFMNLVRS